MDKELAKELIENWIKRQVLLYGVQYFTLPVKDEVIYSYCTKDGIVEYTLLYCMSVYSLDINNEIQPEPSGNL